MARSKMRHRAAVSKSPENVPTIPALIALVQKADSVYDLYGAWVIARGLVFLDIYTRTGIPSKKCPVDRAEDAAIWGMIKTRSASVMEISQKMVVYRALTEHGIEAGEWTDQRDKMLLASITADLEGGDHGLKEQREQQEQRAGCAK